MRLSPDELEVLSTNGAELLNSLGYGGAVRYERLSGGRNNRVYRLTGGFGTLILKWYFHSPYDQRDRLKSEQAFYEYANEAEVGCIAELLGIDQPMRLAVYSDLKGQRPAVAELTRADVDDAIEFIRALNKCRSRSMSKDLPEASEACFSLQQHIDCVSGRVARLDEISPATDLHREASSFANTTVIPALACSIETLQRWAREMRVPLQQPLDTARRCISPSDFGFHNAIRAADGRLCFYDFEYAGWDDPGKLLCDFYCQPEVPAPRETWDTFADVTASLVDDTPRERQRQALLFPLYQVKWCCILMNEFLATDRQRRTFSERQSTNLALQLDKAKELAEQLS